MRKGVPPIEFLGHYRQDLPGTCENNYCRLLHYHICNFILLTRSTVFKI